MKNALNQANARALVDSVLLSIEKNEFLNLTESYPILSKAVAEYFAMRLSYMVNIVERLALYSVRQRMAVFLIEQADKQKPEGAVSLDPGRYSPAAWYCERCCRQGAPKIRRRKYDPLQSPAYYPAEQGQLTADRRW